MRAILISICLFQALLIGENSLFAWSDYAGRGDKGLYGQIGLVDEIFISEGDDTAVEGIYPRFGFTVELGSRYYGFPLGYSIGNDVHMFWIYPHLQYPLGIGRFALLSGLTLRPQISPTGVKFYFQSIGDLNVTTIELGVRAGGALDFEFGGGSYISLATSYEFSYWRKTSQSGTQGGLDIDTSSSSTDPISLIFIQLALGFRF